MASGRLSLLWTYPSNPNNWVGILSHSTNLIGDPALELWTDTPQVMNAEFTSSIDWGTNFIDVHIADSNGLGVVDANITLLKGEDEIFKSVKTDFYGNATIDLEYESEGTVLLTVTKKNHKPIVPLLLNKQNQILTLPKRHSPLPKMPQLKFKIQKKNQKPIVPLLLKKKKLE